MSKETTEETKKNEEPIIKIRVICFDGILGAKDVEILTGLSRVSIWRLENEGKFPARVQLTGSRVGWYGWEIKAWIASRPRVNLVDNNKGDV